MVALSPTTAELPASLPPSTMPRKARHRPPLPNPIKTTTSMDGLNDNADNNNNNNNNHMVMFGGYNFESDFLARLKDEGYGSQDGSENLDAGSGDEVDVDQVELVDAGEHEQDQQSKKKKYHRHTPQQIQILESFFKECPHPDEKQRNELSRRLGLENKQIKFWFQNRRTQLKTQMERHENAMLREDNSKLRNENHSMRTRLNRPTCGTCGGPAVLHGSRLTPEEQQLKLENARLKDELSRICVLTNKFLGKPISNFARSVIPPPPAPNGLENASIPVGGTVSSALEFHRRISMSKAAIAADESSAQEKSMFLELAVCAMNELIKLAEVDAPLWVRSLNGAGQVLNHDEYTRVFSPNNCPMRSNFVPEGSRETGILLINNSAAVEMLMDVNRWMDVFHCMVARASTVGVISSGISGNRNGALQLMEAELQVLSPLVPVRRIKFIRFCKQHAEGVWAVADISVDLFLNSSGGLAVSNCKRLPSGCILQDMPNGCSKLTWIEHSEYDESLVPDLYRLFLRSGLGFGAQRWVATLQRQCEFFTMTVSGEDPSGINLSGRKSMLKLARRMVDSFCSGVSTSTTGGWEILNAGNIGKGIRVMTRTNSLDNFGGMQPGILLSASTSVWMPVSHEVLFNFLRDERVRSEWDVLSRGGLLHEMVHIAKGQSRENCVSLLRANPSGDNETGNDMLILQETWTDATGSLIAYAPVDQQSMNVVMGGGDSSLVGLVPSGFVILPDVCDPSMGGNAMTDSCSSGSICGGSLLTMGFQILVSSVPVARLNAESVETVNDLIACTVHRIKASLQLA